ncbi:MAG: pyridoxal phosphate-dependent aminotransferase [Rhodothermales bacterium]|nr:pyridoxal phosphate-dependent aminotransferase [Rhodothermales bacterium]
MSPIGVDRMGSVADQQADESILRLENLDTNLALPDGVVGETRNAVARDRSNSYLPFFGNDDLRSRIGEHCNRRSGLDRDWERSVILSAGGLSGILNVLLALLDEGDEVVVQDPIYIGLLNRIKLAGGVPVFTSFMVTETGFNLDRSSLKQCITPRTKAFLMMSPVMPSGAVMTRMDWEAACAACIEADAWMIYNSAMETYRFDGAEYYHPAMFPGMDERTITVGSFSKEFRMIGWRIGWIDAPESLANSIALVSISNVVCNVGFSQAGCLAALQEEPGVMAGLVAEMEARRDLLCSELSGFGAIKPGGGWSMLVDTSSYAESATLLSEQLLNRSRIAATPMAGWGRDTTDRYLRLVFSNESQRRLTGIRERFERAI